MNVTITFEQNSKSKEITIGGFWNYQDVINDLAKNATFTPKNLETKIENINDENFWEYVEWDQARSKNKYGLTWGANSNNVVTISNIISKDTTNRTITIEFKFKYKDKVSNSHTQKHLKDDNKSVLNLFKQKI